jgi:two-component system chemotaxis sensor kinase CheA
MDIEKFRAMFLNEAAEHLQQMTQLLILLEDNPTDRESIDALFREAHSVKGMAATMDYQQTARLAHYLEDNLDYCRKLGRIESAQIDEVLEAVDLLEVLLGDIDQGILERDVSSFLDSEKFPLKTSLEKTSTAAINQGKLMRLQLKDSTAAVGPRFLVLLRELSHCGEILESQPTQEEIIAGTESRELSLRLVTQQSEDEIRRQLEAYSEIEKIDFVHEDSVAAKNISKASVSRTIRVNTERLDQLINLTGELITNRYHLQGALREQNWQEMDEGIGRMAGLIKHLHHQVLKVRMVSLDQLIGRLSRTVHDVARSSGKQVEFSVDCANLELDRSIIDELVEPLTHMVRNAIDHGIAKQGKVMLKAWRERDQVLLQIEDDGRGLAPDKIKAKALEQGLLTPDQVGTIRDVDLYQLICHPGFSTAEKVTEVSGRGVGMDIVKTAIERIGGMLMIDSVVGAGTKMTLKLPLSLAIIRVLQVECDAICMAMPITRVIQTLEVGHDEIHNSGKQLLVRFQGELLPLLSLRKILKQPKGEQRNPIAIVVTEVLGRKVGLVVDRLIGQREIFLQRLPEPFDRICGCNGGTILGDGSIIFLLDVQLLLEKRRKI